MVTAPLVPTKRHGETLNTWSLSKDSAKCVVRNTVELQFFLLPSGRYGFSSNRTHLLKRSVSLIMIIIRPTFQSSSGESRGKTAFILSIQSNPPIVLLQLLLMETFNCQLMTNERLFYPPLSLQKKKSMSWAWARRTCRRTRVRGTARRCRPRCGIALCARRTAAS